MENRKAIQKMRVELLIKKIDDEMTVNRFLARKKFQQWINCMNVKSCFSIKDMLLSNVGNLFSITTKRSIICMLSTTEHIRGK